MAAIEIGSVVFQWAWVLAALPILWLLLFWMSRSKKKPAGLFLPTFQSIANLSNHRTRAIKLLPWIRLAALSLLLIALAKPQKILKEEKIKADGIDIALVIDLSSSMLAKDFSPSRLEVTKQMAIDFVNKRGNDRISLSTFAGEAFSQCPLTSDHRVVIELLRNLDQGYLEDGTAIGMGLASGVNRLKDSESKSKIIILLTDGVNNSGYIDPLTASKLADDYQIKIYVIGVGTDGQALSPVSRTASGQFVYGYTRVEIDEALMTEIANLTGGQYFRATDETSLQQIYNRINVMEKTKIERTVIKKNIDYFHVFLWWALGLLALEILLRNTWLRTPLLKE